jgi:hypothetical protein
MTDIYELIGSVVGSLFLLSFILEAILLELASHTPADQSLLFFYLDRFWMLVLASLLIASIFYVLKRLHSIVLRQNGKSIGKRYVLRGFIGMLLFSFLIYMLVFVSNQTYQPTPEPLL